MKETTIYAPTFHMLLGILVLIVFFTVGGAKAAQTEDAEANVAADSPEEVAGEESTEAVDCEATIDLPICQRSEVPHSGA